LAHIHIVGKSSLGILIHAFAVIIKVVIRQGISFYRWINAAKFLTGASAMGSLAIPAILRHAGLIETGAMFIEFTSFFILVCTVLCFHRATVEDDW
jgi:hypothetical protein